MENKVIVDNIRSAIKSKGLTVPTVEETLGFSSGLISRWNKSVPSLDKIISIAELLHISIDDLIGIHPSNSSSQSDELFINKVIQQTESNILTWNIIDENTKDSVYNFKEEKEEYESYYSEYYYCKYNNSFFLLQANYIIDEHQLDELYISFFIQPDANDSDNIVLQIEDEDILAPLWNVIRYPFYGELAELKAQKLIDQFMEEDSMQFSHISEFDCKIQNDKFAEYIVKQMKKNGTFEKLNLTIERIKKDKELNETLHVLLKNQELIEDVYKNRKILDLFNHYYVTVASKNYSDDDK